MEIIQYSNGPEGAENSFEELFAEFSQAVIHSNSRAGYKSAISAFLGHEGLVGPVKCTRDGISYAFDFRCLDEGRFFKIFSAQNLSEYERYLAYPGKKTVLINVDKSYWNQSRLFDDENPLLMLPDENEKQIKAASTLLYSFSRLWEVDHQTEAGELVWRPIQLRAAPTTIDRPVDR